MPEKSFQEQLKEYTDYVNRILPEYLPGEEGQQKNLRRAENYSMYAGGKRLRPIFILLSYRMFGGKGKEIEPFMAGMEMIHTHSLVHDDLPAMDNDRYRRGRLSTHAAFGEAPAILAGDALLNRAYETMARSFKMGADPALAGRTIGIIADKTGRMIEGQSVDVEMDGRPLSRDQLHFIYAFKTGALIEGSLMAGASLAGAGEEDLSRMEMIGREIGIAFQICDDILDVTGTQEELGKPVGSDEKNNKTTYVTLYGIEKARADARKLTQSAITRLDNLSVPGDRKFLRQLLLSLTDRKS